MRVKNIIKIVIDILMMGLLIAMLFVYQTGLIFHEIIGLFFIFIILLHMLLNGKWIIGTTKKLLSEKIKAKRFLSYLLSLILFFCTATVYITGIMISKILFPMGSYNQVIIILHRWVAYAMIGMIVIHLALHLRYLKVMCKNIIAEIRTPVVMKSLSSVVAILFVSAVIFYNIILAYEKSLYADASEVMVRSQFVGSDYTASNVPVDELESDPLESYATSSQEISENDNGNTVADIPSDISLLDEPEVYSKEYGHTWAVSSTVAEDISLSEFLENIFCTLCPNHCPLSNPQCRKSTSLIDQATLEYNQIYTDN